MSTLTDTELIQAAKNGKEQAFKELVDKYESPIAATVIGMLGRCAEAQDVGQETFIRFYNALSDFRGEAGVGTYLIRIAINLSLNELKRRKRRREIYNDEIDFSQIQDKNNDQEKSGLIQTVRTAVAQLKPKYRVVVVLRLIMGHSTRETAAILELPPGTVLSRLARAQKMLRQIL